MAVSAFIPPIDLVVVFVPRLQDPCPRLALLVGADHELRSIRIDPALVAA
jgi:hypothetical protein